MFMLRRIDEVVGNLYHYQVINAYAKHNGRVQVLIVCDSGL